jgi:hypothetical protein
MSNNNILKKIDLAKALRVSPSAVTAWICKGMPCRRDGKIDRGRALAWLSENVEVQIGSKGLKGAARSGAVLRKGIKRSDDNGDDGLDPVQTRALRDAAIARRYELQNDIATGKVVSIEGVTQVFAEQLSIIRNHFLALGTKLAPRLVGCTTATEIKDLIDAEVVRILTALSSLDGDGGESVLSIEERERVVRSRLRRSAQHDQQQ